MKITETEIIHKYLRSLTFDNKSSLMLKDDVFYEKKKNLLFPLTRILKTNIL